MNMAMKVFAELKHGILDARTSKGDRLIDIYPWIKRFYLKPGMVGTRPESFYPVRGQIITQMIDMNTMLQGDISIRFLRINDKLELEGFSGHANSFFPIQYRLITDEVKNADA